MKKTTIRTFVAIMAISMSFASCQMLNSVTNQLSGLANLANCEYKLKNVSNVTVAGVNVKQVAGGNISVADVLKLTTALASKKVPLQMNVNVDVNNPTANNAMLTAMDWIMEIDGKQFATGANNNAYTIAANNTTTIPLGVSTDVYSMFSQGGIESLKNFVSSFSGDGTSSKVGLKIKPSISVGGVNIPSPSYIKLEKTTGTK